MVRPVMHGRIEAISRERDAWTRNQIAKRFKLSMAKSDLVISKAIKCGVLDEKKDGYNRHGVITKDFKFTYT